jgi:hypothetical protein
MMNEQDMATETFGKGLNLLQELGHVLRVVFVPISEGHCQSVNNQQVAAIVTDYRLDRPNIFM